MAYKRKTRDVYILELDYGYGHWEFGDHSDGYPGTLRDKRKAMRELLPDWISAGAQAVRIRKARERIDNEKETV